MIGVATMAPAAAKAAPMARQERAVVGIAPSSMLLSIIPTAANVFQNMTVCLLNPKELSRIVRLLTYASVNSSGGLANNTERPDVVSPGQLPPTSAGSGGGSDVVGVGVARGAVDVEGAVDVVGAVGAVVGLVAPGRWKSSIFSSRITRAPVLMVSAFDVTVYSIPSLSAVKAPSEDREAEVMSLAPSRTRTPRYW